MQLSSSQIDILKLLAVFFMIIDHVNKIFIDYEVFFLLGRIVYPIFTILLVYNYIHNSSNQTKYIKRLFLFAFISQVPFFLYFENTILNIIFTLALSLSFIHFILNTNKNNIEKFGSFILISSILYILPFDIFEYGLLGFLSTISFYYFFTLKNKIFSLPIIFVNGLDISRIIFTSIPLLIVHFIQKINIKIEFDRQLMSRFFYLFYPGHLFILYLIKIML